VPLLGIWLELCRRYRIDEVLINVHAHSEAVRNYLTATQNGIRVRIFEEPTLLGSAGTIAANRAWVCDEPFFWIFYADVLTNLNLRAMLDFHMTRRTAATLAVSEVPDPTRCGVVTVNQHGTVTHFVEKPAVPTNNLAFSGVAIGTHRLLKALPESAPADIGFQVLHRLVGDMSAYNASDYLVDIGTVSNYLHAQNTWPGL
jgi:mannose-1-phosphate guanylyltransferase